MKKTLAEVYGFNKAIAAKDLRRIILQEYRSILREQEEEEAATDFAAVNTGTNIADLDGAEAYRQLSSGDENAPLIQAMMNATGWAAGAVGKAGGAEAIKAWAEETGESELASRISQVGSALPASGLPKNQMPALEGDDAPQVKDALSPGGRFNVDLEADYAGGEESVDAWISSLSDKDQEAIAGGKEPDVKKEGLFKEDKFPGPGKLVGAGGGADPVGKALAFLVKGKHDGNEKDDNINVKVGGSLANSKMIPTQSNILAGKSLLFAFLQGTGNSDLSDMGGAFVTSAGEILDGHHRWSGAFIGTGGGLNHSNVHVVDGSADDLIPALTAIGNALGNPQKESVASRDGRIMERWGRLAGLLNS